MTAEQARELFAASLAQLQLSPGPWLVAVSGGPDSVALLQLLAEQASTTGIRPIVAHIDHGIHPDSAAVASLVERHAQRLGLDFTSARLELGVDATETAARQARYEALRSLASETGAQGIITAHHEGDQVETVLMRVLRGSGPAGLGGMGASGDGAVVRPALGLPQRALAAVTQAMGLEHWLDPANRDPVHLRSWIRGSLIPRLREHLPDVESRLLQVASQARDQREAWDELLQRLPGLDISEAPASMSALPWLAADSPLARQLLRALGRRAGARLSHSAVQRALALVRGGVSGRRALMGEGWSAEYSFGRIVLAREASIAQEVMPLEGDLGRLVWQGWQVRWRRASAGSVSRDGNTTWVTPGPLSIGPPQQGERLQPLGFSGRRPLVRLLQEARLPVSQRRHWPVLRRGSDIIWIPGVCRSGLAVPAVDGEAIQLTFESLESPSPVRSRLLP